MRKTHLCAAVLLLALTLAGCMTAREAMVARLEIATSTCASAPALSGATAFIQEKKDAPFTATIRFGDTAPCVVDASGAKSVYAVLDIPTGDGQGIITVTSFAMGQTIFSPRLEFRDEQGTIARQVARETFMFNGSSLQTQLRQRAGERYLVIASDASSVGRSVEQIQSQVNSSGVMVGTAFVPINTGVEGRATLVFAHNGEVTTTIAPMPKADGK